MLAAALALVGALAYGSADFLGGVASRRLRAVVVTCTAAFAGLILLGLAYPLLGGTWNTSDLMWGALSGISGAVAIGLLYACLAIGPMSILSPLTAVVSAVAPMVWGLVVGGERLALTGNIGLVLALVAVVLVAFLPGETIRRPALRGLLMAVGSGIAIGAFLVLIDQTSAASGVVPLIANRAVNGIITAAIVGMLVLRAARSGAPAASAFAPAAAPTAVSPSGHADGGVIEPVPLIVPLRRAWMLAVCCGIVDAVANVLLVLALRAGGDLAVVAALTAMYPAGTVLLAAVVLRERIAPVQWAGLALALTAGILLAIG